MTFSERALESTQFAFPVELAKQSDQVAAVNGSLVKLAMERGYRLGSPMYAAGQSLVHEAWLRLAAGYCQRPCSLRYYSALPRM